MQEQTRDAMACPSCGAPLDAGQVLCVACGVNIETGERLSTHVEPAAWSEQCFDIRFARGVGGEGSRVRLLSPGRVIIDHKDRIRVVGQVFDSAGCLALVGHLLLSELLGKVFRFALWALEDRDDALRDVTSIWIPSKAQAVCVDSRRWISIEAEPGRWLSFVPLRKGRLGEESYVAMKAELARVLGDRLVAR